MVSDPTEGPEKNRHYQMLSMLVVPRADSVQECRKDHLAVEAGESPLIKMLYSML